ncbi:MAG: tetratricopeptide repeat protein, partial [Parabacteroides sp.]
AFGPQMTDRWTEYWFPVKGIGGISKASRIGALHVTRETDGHLKLAFSPLAALSTEVKIYEGDRLLQTLPLQTKVLEPWSQTIPELGKIAQGRLRVMIGEHDLVYTEVENDYLLHRPKELPADFDWNSVYGLYIQGEQYMNQKYNQQAESYLKQALEKDKYFAPALNRLASLYYREGRWEEALTLLKRALSLNAYDEEANYLYGLCNRALGRTADAKDGFSVATYSPAFRSAAYAQLAEMCLKEQDWQKAEHYAQKGLDYNRLNLDARQVLMVVYRRTHRPEAAREQIEAVLTDLPLYHFARWEQLYAATGSGHPMEDFQSLVRNELPFETYLELAGWYESVGCQEEALALLSCAGSYPIALYKRAYLLDQMGQTAESRQLLQQAEQASPERVFPFRIEDRPALAWAATQSDDWKATYYQGLIDWANQQQEEALQKLEACGTPDYAPFYLTRAKLRQLLPTLAKGSFMEDLQKAEQTELSWRTGFALINAYTAQADWNQVVETGKRYMKRYPDNYYIGLKLAKGYCETAQYTACIKLLKGMEVLPNEGAYAGRAVYRAANLHEAMDYLRKKSYNQAQRALTASQEWPENLGVGKPYEDQIDSRLEEYIQSRIYTGKGASAQAAESLTHVAAGRHTGRHFSSGNLLTALAMRELGRTQEADQWVASWQQNFPDNRIVEWCTAIYQGKRGEAQKLLAGRNSEHDSTPWEAAYQDVDFDLIARLF